ncbi:transporter substrate-binding domain-containing protein [Clostridium sp. SHJSY1]|uniref:substrate-binding periplasmic protein n=1 Tax=Clostridium sp. SHJSY1 TaxID=2942483 RepID=UPI0028765EC5|nr:transporter substrate-binding domain-containing protein [Clostridium sp. SHJSY1]MDS0526060.1 transporter substrate-binding domain-containing protein [Clostridium sp. SHJSY1]
MKNFFKFLVALIVILNLTTNANGKMIQSINKMVEVDRLQKIREEGILTVVSPDEEPYSYKNPKSGAFSGLDAEIIKEVAKRLGIKEVKVRYIPFANALQELIVNPNIDLFSQGIFITDERKKVVDFTNSIYTEKEAILTREDSDINSTEDLKNKTIGVVGGSVYVSMAENWKKQGLLKDYILIFDDYSLKAALKSGMVDAIITDSIIAENMILVSPKDKFKLLSPSQYKSEIDFNVGYPLKKGDTTLLNAINEKLKEMKEDGTLYEILGRYGLFNHYIP